jgi:hypothetical protein
MTELACNDDVPGSNNAFLRAVLDPGEYFVLMDQYGGDPPPTGGMYTLALRTWDPAPNALCTGALPLAAGAMVTGDVTRGGPPGGGCLADWGPQLFYTLRVPPGQRAVVTATPTGTPAWSAVLRARASCTADSCLSNGRSPMPGMPAVERVDNRGTAPLDAVVSVASTTGLTGGPFSLGVALEPLGMSPANAVCAAARVVADGAMLAGEDASAGSTRLNGVCLGGAQGTVLYYRVDLPSRATAVVTATPRGGWDAVVRALDGCAVTSCLASASAAGPGAAETLTYTNIGAATATVFLAVGSVDAGSTGPFDLAVRVLPPPTNVTCAAAAMVAHGASLSAQNSAAGLENATGACLPAATGTVLWYRAVVPPRQTLTARVTPAATVDPVLPGPAWSRPGRTPTPGPPRRRCSSPWGACPTPAGDSSPSTWPSREITWRAPSPRPVTT